MRIDKTFKSLPKKFHKNIPEAKTMLHPEPTPGCVSGYSGRTAVTEVLPIDQDLQELILKNASEEEFYQSARKNGFVTIQEDAIIKALNHEIPYEEMNAFSTKIGIETLLEEDYDPVDNLQEFDVTEAIMGNDEDTSD